MANVNINQELWSQVNEEDKKTIEELLQKTKSINEDDKITPVEVTSEPQPENFFCKAACETSFVAATTACAGLSGPAFAACMVLAAEARRECLKGC
ncbi:hypothetical protein [Bacillus safensis]|uniref:hypothetical protein n=1 Tax=Bacillus safensis TaxID=561879 RepID=UPI001CCBE7CF|nr:hypothetical protein [Bacillus safensis]MBZ9521901.1 hypothetical protein [Bacillus safensis]